MESPSADRDSVGAQSVTTASSAGLPPQNIVRNFGDFTFISESDFTYDTLQQQLDENPQYKFKQPQAFPKPDGVSADEWDKSFNAANSQVYQNSGKSAKVAATKRETTHEVRHLAEIIQKRKMHSSGPAGAHSASNTDQARVATGEFGASTTTPVTLASIIQISDSESVVTEINHNNKAVESVVDDMARIRDGRLGIFGSSDNAVGSTVENVKDTPSMSSPAAASSSKNKGRKTTKNKKKGTAKKVGKKETTNDLGAMKLLSIEESDDLEDSGAASEALSSTDDGTLYCICNGPDNHRYMIGCDGGCENWFHGDCIGIRSKEDGDLVEKFICPSCKAAGKVTTYKRHCRLESCRKPITVFNKELQKYCSWEHLLQWAREFLDRFPDTDEPSRGGPLTRKEVIAMIKGVKNAEELHALGKPPILHFPLKEDSRIRYQNKVKDLVGPTFKKREVLEKLGKPPDGVKDDEVIAEHDDDYELALASKALTSEDTQLLSTGEYEAELMIISFFDDKELIKAAKIYDIDWDNVFHEEEKQTVTDEMELSDYPNGRIKVFEQREKVVEWTKKYTDFIIREECELSPPKDYCGFDWRLLRNEDEYRTWTETDNGRETIENEKVGLPTHEDIEYICLHAKGPKSSKDVWKGVCIKRRCKAHMDWYRIHRDEQRQARAELVQERKEWEQYMEELFDVAELRESSNGAAIYRALVIHKKGSSTNGANRPSSK